ncbi:MAG: CapA family protein, partial [Cyclobacteriaceae bacterium]
MSSDNSLPSFVSYLKKLIALKTSLVVTHYDGAFSNFGKAFLLSHMRYTFLLAFFLHSLLSNAQDTLSMTFIGDIMQHGPQITSAYNSAAKKYQYDSCFKYIRHEMSSSDLTIANLEFTFGGEPYSGYPMFSAPDQMGEALQNAGVDVLVTANNHTCDRRKAGVIRTLDVLDTLQMAH